MCRLFLDLDLQVSFQVPGHHGSVWLPQQRHNHGLWEPAWPQYKQAVCEAVAILSFILGRRVGQILNLQMFETSVGQKYSNLSSHKTVKDWRIDLSPETLDITWPPKSQHPPYLPSNIHFCFQRWRQLIGSCTLPTWLKYSKLQTRWLSS